MASVMTVGKSDDNPNKFSLQTTEHRPVPLQNFSNANHYVRFSTYVTKGGSPLPYDLIAACSFSDVQPIRVLKKLL